MKRIALLAIVVLSGCAENIIIKKTSDNNSTSLDATAIDIQKQGELLSAPKVIATCGGTVAEVDMITEHFYPESWDTIRINEKDK